VGRGFVSGNRELTVNVVKSLNASGTDFINVNKTMGSVSIC